MEIKLYSAIHKQDCLRVFDSNLDKYFAPHEREQFVEFLDSVTQADDNQYYVALQDGQLVGCGGLRLYQDTVYLSWGMLARTKHKTGLGEQLLRHRLEQATRLHPGKEIVIETSQHTQGFFARYGFAIEKSETNGFGEGIDKVTMRLNDQMHSPRK
ncbi:GNAT family N-acetyltransferase [Hahella sp. HN01]|uniref:GNAT family N-acetyltransferase n=1 Tax=Hahella sp. HN01 TaxID=2847262 RepID=UPI001C1EA684|nr:GNAT family N-acetyltransferase [Hahella sp. HN01]MBU6952044.1 GNAT family N-acetyltransferase [Hahella sp. HN01]